MWIFCSGMRRSGSTLQFQLTAHIVEKAGLGQRVEWVRATEFAELRAKYAVYEGWKVAKSHICTPEMLEEFELHNALAVYIFRDVRDALVSFMNLRPNAKDAFERAIGEKFLERVLAEYDRWTTLPRVLVTKYEHAIADLPGEVARIAQHLNITLTPEQCAQYAAEYSIERQKARIEQAEIDPASGKKFDPHSLLHKNHIRSGQAGRWKEVLSPIQVAKVEQIAGKWLVENGYELSGHRLNLLTRIRSRILR